jgi:hypothetical protein
VVAAVVTVLRRRLARSLVQLLIRRIREDNETYRAAAYLEDMGYDECPVCVANRRRMAFRA